ncbi:hypothetical protein SAMN05880501_107156 [Ureibacillus xyleni]|uniref:Uncharacterized protein n=1 Tax=Ureibacillus xyleni TaxID=614648 RepID=A0A285SXS9_9BACL|nr:hypothetical protein [Ureibacillus xyleni]SOC13322.1 hypothetical protein SAMN05880501_107156 [Ureibacillus xyleni]
MIFILENIFQLSAIILALCSIYYYRHFKKTRKERKLTFNESVIYIVTRIAIYLCAASYVVLFLDRNFG